MGACCGGDAPVFDGVAVPRAWRVIPGLRGRAAAFDAAARASGGYGAGYGYMGGDGPQGPICSTGSCGCASCSARASGDVGDPPEDEDEGDYATMDRDTWEAMTPAERTSWLRSIARTDAERARLIATGVSGGFDTLRRILADRQATERTRLRTEADRRLAESRERIAEERRLAEEARRDRDRGAIPYTTAQSNSAMLVGGAALLWFVLGKR